MSFKPYSMLTDTIWSHTPAFFHLQNLENISVTICVHHSKVSMCIKKYQFFFFFYHCMLNFVWITGWPVCPRKRERYTLVDRVVYYWLHVTMDSTNRQQGTFDPKRLAWKQIFGRRDGRYEIDRFGITNRRDTII